MCGIWAVDIITLRYTRKQASSSVRLPYFRQLGNALYLVIIYGCIDPSGMIVPLRDLASANCPEVTLAPRRSTLFSTAPFKFALLRSTFLKITLLKLALLRSAPMKRELLRSESDIVVWLRVVSLKLEEVAIIWMKVENDISV